MGQNDNENREVTITPDGEVRIREKPPALEDSFRSLKDTEEVVIKGSQPLSNKELMPWDYKSGAEGLEVTFRDTERPETFTESLGRSQLEAQAERERKKQQRGGKIGAVPFSSRAEKEAAFADPRYGVDPAYREEVAKRLAVTPF